MVIEKFMVGIYGDFDRLALSVCRELRKKYLNIKIYVVITKLSYLTKDIVGFSNLDLYRDVETMFMPIEDEYYKNKIIKNNQLMVDQSSIIICYVDFSKLYSGAKKSVLYAKRKNKTIINLFNNLS